MKRVFNDVYFWLTENFHKFIIFFVFAVPVYFIYICITHDMKCTEMCGLDNYVRECNYSTVVCEPRPKDNLLRYHLK